MAKKQPWYEKATVQSSIINAVPNIVTGIIAVIAIIAAAKYSNLQIKQNQVNFEKQMHRDSLINIEQDSVAKLQIQYSGFQFA